MTHKQPNQIQVYDGNGREIGRIERVRQVAARCFLLFCVVIGRAREVANRNPSSSKEIQKDKREGDCRIKSMKSRSELRKRPEGI